MFKEWKTENGMPNFQREESEYSTVHARDLHGDVQLTYCGPWTPLDCRRWKPEQRELDKGLGNDVMNRRSVGVCPDLIRASSRERRRVQESKWLSHRVYTTGSGPVPAKANVGEGSAPQYEFAGTLVGRLAAVGKPERASNNLKTWSKDEKLYTTVATKMNVPTEIADPEILNCGRLHVRAA